MANNHYTKLNTHKTPVSNDNYNMQRSCYWMVRRKSVVSFASVRLSTFRVMLRYVVNANKPYFYKVRKAQGKHYACVAFRRNVRRFYAKTI